MRPHAAPRSAWSKVLSRRSLQTRPDRPQWRDNKDENYDDHDAWAWNTKKGKYEKTGGPPAARKTGKFASYNKYKPQGPTHKPGTNADGTRDGTYGIHELSQRLAEFNGGGSDQHKEDLQSKARTIA